ncbi:MFS transporter (plasmid) [Bartonella sp. HY329]|uniref:MFS transporter n=1 Tax=unclassified Bartonella TaxID=2645622 RepID=UPI0021CAB137|nr:MULTISPECIES: MFS transporter [unclassified Bartonella]UXM96520.1 MFS transporter [Bartonella sp. HY329]UXN10843.1 MFS transporter [Bartonella sp. HY328]
MDNKHQGYRNLCLLTVAQALGASSPPIIISLGGLVGRNLSDNAAIATLPVSIYQAGVALSVIPAAFFMRQLGRRCAYLVGAIFGVLSGLVAAYGIIHGSLFIFCLGTLLAGIYGAHVQSYRFAATDGVSPQMRNRAISWIMVGGLIAAVIGPQLANRTRNSFENIEFVGSFLSQTGLALLVIPILFFYRPIIQTDSQTLHNTSTIKISEILRIRGFLLAAIAGAISFALMSFLMTATPMAMHDHHHSIDQATLGIQWHILAMFGPSFVTGTLINKFGAERITAIGLTLIMLSAFAALTGYGLIHFFTALILLGLGWNFGFIGATAMVAALSTPQNKTKMQGINDFIVFGSVAVSSFLSGVLLESAGWVIINLLVFPIVLAILIPLLWRQSNEKKQDN